MVLLAGFGGQYVLPVAPPALSAPPADTQHSATEGHNDGMRKMRPVELGSQQTKGCLDITFLYKAPYMHMATYVYVETILIL
ncbi:hypothetical protein DUI87_07471 [Hirundo rustica rustica]|uniref:Uncharacterized protein n=1 Tax=Hirundo rustica rustica TaxID=333673 RepID=A0A3M0KPU7_HIRRU|nr:hypothetical protein DUI87_07471 [Hirundo rustica rustica]